MSGKFEYPSSSEFEHIGSTSESALSKMNLPVSALCLTLSKEPQYNSRSISSTFLTLSNCQWFEALKPSFVEMVRPEGRSIIELLTLTSNLPAILSIRAEVPLISFFRIIPPSFKSRVSSKMIGSLATLALLAPLSLASPAGRFESRNVSPFDSILSSRQETNSTASQSCPTNNGLDPASFDTPLYTEPYRPQLHFTPSSGFM